MRGIHIRALKPVGSDNSCYNPAMKTFPASIIHADDDRIMQGLVKKSLADTKGLTLRFCQDGVQLLKALREAPPDLVLMDISMPHLDGIGAIERMRREEALASILVILMTGHTELKMQPRYKALGIIGIIHKPISAGVLPERIRYLWHLHHTGEDIEIGGSAF